MIPEDRKLANEFPLTDADYAKLVGALPLGGELSYTPVERNGFRPTIEINGIHSGYGGPGGKTIIPSTAIAKITSACGWSGSTLCLNLIANFLKEKAPVGVTVEVSDLSDAGGALLVSSKSPLITVASEVLREVTQQPPLFYWVGASVPIVGTLAKTAGG